MKDVKVEMTKEEKAMKIILEARTDKLGNRYYRFQEEEGGEILEMGSSLFWVVTKLIVKNNQK